MKRVQKLCQGCGCDITEKHAEECRQMYNHKVVTFKPTIVEIPDKKDKKRD